MNDYALLKKEKRERKIMRQKSDKKKLQEGRCLGDKAQYVGFIKANEAKSIGTATEIYDPVSERMVDVLSMGEKKFFWILRYQDDVAEIREQMLMNAAVVKKICEEHGFPVPKRILSTDFFVTYADGSSIAYSIKSDRSVFDKAAVENRRYRMAYEKLLIRQYIEKEYWKQHGAAFRIVFGNELNSALARNIEACMAFYDHRYVTDDESLLKYLIAHKEIRIPLDKEILNFVKLAKEREKELIAVRGKIKW